MNRICLCLTGSTIDEDLRLLSSHRPLVQMAEVRVDLLAPTERPLAWRIALAADLPLILTARRARDGGRFEGDERDRLGLLASLVHRAADYGRGFAFLDLEDDLGPSQLEPQFRAKGGRIIRSRHDLLGVPARLAELIRELRRHPTDLPKVACLARGCADLVALFEAGRAAKGERILIGMGEYGFATRILTPLTGSYLTFASPADSQQPAGPGHTDPLTLCHLYRYPRIGPSTAVYAVIGDPVMHSRSPHIHNRGFRLLGMDAVYIPVRVDSLPDFLRLADLLAIRGVSVTIPHKEGILPFLASQDPEVTAVGACNTLLRTPRGWHGMNTDVSGFLAPLEQSGFDAEGKRATVIGAGGAARAVVCALRGRGASVLILNRTPSRARELAEAFGCEWAPLEPHGFSRAASYSDLIVQTTCVGMEPHPDEDPVQGYAFSGREWVYDLVYRPRETRLLRRAAACGCRTLRGGQMLIAQALDQFRAFSGAAYPDPQGLEQELGL